MNNRHLRILCCAIGMVAFGVDAALANDADITFGANNYLFWTPKELRPEYGLDEGASYTGDTYWWYEPENNPASNLSFLRKYDDDAEKYNGFDEKVNPQPNYMLTGSANEGYIAVSCASECALQRAFCPIASSNAPTRSVSIPTDGLYVDMLVNLEPTIVAIEPKTLADRGDKISVRLFKNEVEDVVTTNLIVTAGSVATEGVVEAVNYIATNEVVGSTWHRLTIKALTNVKVNGTSKTYPAFKVFIDGIPVATESSDTFLSMQLAAKGTGLKSIAMSGVCKVDEIGVTTENPLAVAADEIETVIACNDDALASFTYELKRGEEDAKVVELEKPFNGAIITNKPGDVVVFKPVAAALSKLAGKVTAEGNPKAVDSISGYTLTCASGDEFEDSSKLTIRISTTSSYFQYDGVNYTTFREVMETIQDDTGKGEVALLQSMKIDANSVDEGQLQVLPGLEVTLDLKGMTITGQNFENEAAILAQGQLTIVNSDPTGAGGIVAPGQIVSEVRDNRALEVKYESARLVLGGENSKQFQVIGKVAVATDEATGEKLGELVIMGGTFANPSEAEADNFYLQEYVADDGRFKATKTTIDFGGETLGGFIVESDNKCVFRFSTEMGGVTIAKTNVVIGESFDLKLVAVTNLVGWQHTGWTSGTIKYATDEVLTIAGSCNFAAEIKTIDYAVTYTGEGQYTSNPKSYTVTSEVTELKHNDRQYFTFVGWRKVGTDKFVTNIGKGACYEGTDELIIGDLELESVWTENQFSWGNTTDGLVESNATYGGSLVFKIPDNSGLYTGLKFKVKEIDFCVVNPVTYTNAAAYLSVIPYGETTPVTSQKVSGWYMDESEYVYETLKNRRPKLKYVFDDLVVTVGRTNGLYFASNASGEKGKGFLRLGQIQRDESAVIWNCLDGEEYQAFRPIYEIVGEVVDK